MPNTTFFGWSYPNDNDEPYFESEELFKQAQDITVYSLMNTANNVVIPPASIMWTPNILSWSGSFEIPVMSNGYSAYVQFAPDGVSQSVALNDGDRIYVIVPTTLSTSTQLEMKIINGKVPTTNGVVTLGFCRGTSFYKKWATEL